MTSTALGPEMDNPISKMVTVLEETFGLAITTLSRLNQQSTNRTSQSSGALCPFSSYWEIFIRPGGYPRPPRLDEGLVFPAQRSFLSLADVDRLSWSGCAKNRTLLVATGGSSQHDCLVSWHADRSLEYKCRKPEEWRR